MIPPGAVPEPATTEPAADLIRVFFVFTPAFVILGMTLYIAVYYFRSWRFAKKNGLARRGLLPLHVWTIATSYLLLLADAIISAFERRSTGLTWHAVILVPATTLGIFALWQILQHSRLRVMQEDRTRREIDDVLKPGKPVDK